VEGFLVVRGLTKRFGDFRAVDDVSFEVEEGELLVLLGPSGCGKTTTLRCIGGLEHPEAGEILIEDQPVTDAAKGWFLQPEARGMGMVAQSYAIWPHMSVYENIAFPLRMRKERGDVVSSRVQEALEMVQLGGLGDRNATDLSGGQQQRVALARAIVGRPRVLLFDEPLSNLDAKLREQMRYLLKDVQREIGITAVYVTHDQAEAMGLGDELLVMNAGRIEQRGSARELYREPRTRFVAEFIGVANMLKGTVVETPSKPDGAVYVRLGDDDGKTIVKCRGGACDLGKKVTVLVRPEWFEATQGRPQSDQSAIKGTVRNSQYLGERTELLVSTEYGELRVNASGDVAYQQGQVVHLSIDDDKSIALPATA
jgi:iron(III) transport system ATP-binding protein